MSQPMNNITNPDEAYGMKKEFDWFDKAENLRKFTNCKLHNSCSVRSY